jgi:tripartite-type tricarboxylate transporter receptor subunit TctC
VRFDTTKFRWLGTIAPVVETMAVWHTAGVKSVEDVRTREIVAGSTGRGSTTHVYPQMMNEFLDTKFKIVLGYQGGNLINLAMERGEVQARNNTWSSWKATRPAWLKENKIVVIAQAGPRAADLDAPSVEAMARTPDDRKAIELIMSGTRLGRPLATTPDVPAERLAALRAAFRATMADPEFRAEAANANFEVNPVYGEDMQRVVEQIMATPKEIAARVRHLVQ